MSEKEKEDYSFLRAIRAQAFPGDANLQEEAAFERDCSKAVQDHLGRQARGIMVPDDVLTRASNMIVGTSADGGYLKGTDHMGGSWIDQLRNRIMVLQMGATAMHGCHGDIAIPKQTAGHTAEWVAEDGATTVSKPTLASVTLSPKTITAFCDISRQLTLQASPDAEALVKGDLARTLALGIDLAALHGTGTSNQPEGLAVKSTAGDIGSVEGDTNGLAAALSHFVELETDVAVENADMGSLGYLTNAKVRGKAKTTFPNTTGGSIPIWEQHPDGLGWGEVNGHKAGVSNQVSSTLDKGTSTGVCSAIFFGNWADMLIGFWSGLDLLVDPYSLSTTGQIRIVAFQSVDIQLRNEESFSAMLDVLTA